MMLCTRSQCNQTKTGRRHLPCQNTSFLIINQTTVDVHLQPQRTRGTCSQTTPKSLCPGQRNSLHLRTASNPHQRHLHQRFCAANSSRDRRHRRTPSRRVHQRPTKTPQIEVPTNNQPKPPTRSRRHHTGFQTVARTNNHIPVRSPPGNLQIPCKALSPTERQKCSNTSRPTKSYPMRQRHFKTPHNNDGVSRQTYLHVRKMESHLDTVIRKRPRQPSNRPPMHNSSLRSRLQPAPQVVFIQRIHHTKRTSTSHNRQPRRRTSRQMRHRSRHNQSTLS